MNHFDQARLAIDAAHAADPKRTTDGQPAELVYADRMEAWVNQLVPEAPPLLRLAARCQHLERWSVPRDSFPLDKPGYHAWRRSLYVKQAGRAKTLLLAAGVSAPEADDVADWVAKSGLKTNPGTQALEDAAVLVFLENEIGAFAAQHADYPRGKFIDILRKTWRKLSPKARELALKLDLPPAIAGLMHDALAGPIQRFELTHAPGGPVIGANHPALAGNKYGFEGGCVVKEAGRYHLFTAEMADDPFWVKMRLAHWSSPDGLCWQRISTLYETDGRLTPGDNRFSLWAPMAVFDEQSDQWNLFYVAYRPGQGETEGLHMNGRIWRAVSVNPGRDGIGGPYRDAEIILQPDARAQSWEGQQGTDSFYPWQVGERWYGFYGSHNHCPLGPWLVGLVEAPNLNGPWTRCEGLNPSPIEPVFIENPLVTKVGSHYVAVYDNCAPGDTYIAEPRHIGCAISTDGIHWPKGGNLAVQPETGTAQWSEDLRTALGLIAEEDGSFSVFYTGKVRGQNFWALGVARLQRLLA
ncbi:MAG: DUF4202 family protein [Cephaloticoccus sp.]|nr:DUF4202 family protein [Cephaloticoccus sp.]MCF7759217.1 DUF4202 family protein [Cephaloticoccus sp.]